MPGQPSRLFLPLLIAGLIAACGEIASPPVVIGPAVVELGGSGAGAGPEAVVVPKAKPAHPAPPPAKPADAGGSPQPPGAGGVPEAAVPASPAPPLPQGTRQDAGEPPADGGRDGSREAVKEKAPSRLRPAPSLEVASLPPPLRSAAGLPSDPLEVARLRTRPPMTPPVDTAFDAVVDRAKTSGSAATALSGRAAPERSNIMPGSSTGAAAPADGPRVPPAAAANAEARCREAIRAARESVNQYLALPVDRIADTAWVEDALRVTEVALRACQGQPNEEAATYWRATAFFLHGQYARAALNFRRVADVNGPFNALGYAANLSTLLQTCGDDRPSLDAFRLGGLYEAAGHPDRAATQYTQAARSACGPLRDTAGARLRVMAERLAGGTPAR